MTTSPFVAIDIEGGSGRTCPFRQATSVAVIDSTRGDWGPKPLAVFLTWNSIGWVASPDGPDVLRSMGTNWRLFCASADASVGAAHVGESVGRVRRRRQRHRERDGEQAGDGPEHRTQADHAGWAAPWTSLAWT